MPEEDDEDDESLEAELAALQGRPVQKKRPKKKEGRPSNFSSICTSNFFRISPANLCHVQALS